jgi:hypothetical protein
MTETESLNLFEKEKYINLTTFRKNGQAVPTPVWFVQMDEALYVFTGAQTGKAKRIRANGRASVAPCDARGNPRGEFVPLNGSSITDPAKFRRAVALYKRKYGFQYRLTNWMNALRKRNYTPALIKLALEEPSGQAA